MRDNLYRRKGSPIWYCEFYDAAGKRHRVSTGERERVAARVAAKRLEQETSERRADPRRDEAETTLGHALIYFTDHGGTERRPKTMRFYEQRAAHLAKHMGLIPAGKLCFDDVSTYIRQREAEGASSNTVYKELVTLRQALKMAKVPCEWVPKYKSGYRPRERFLTRAEFSRLCLTLLPHRRLWVQVAVYTGGRLEEVEGLRWEDVDFAAGWLLLRGEKTEGAHRRVPLSKDLRAILGAIRGAIRERSGYVLQPWPGVWGDLIRAAKRTQMDRLSPNDLRRTLASWLVQEGVPLKVVARILGHKSTRMVDWVYGHLDDDSMQSAMDKLAVPRTVPKSGRKETRPGVS